MFLGIDTRSSINGLNGFMVKHSRAYEWIIRYLINFKRKKQDYAVINLSKDKLSLELEEAWQLVLNRTQKIESFGLNMWVWNGTSDTGNRVGSGIYLLQISDGISSSLVKIILAK